jgi:hypothetical protein
MISLVCVVTKTRWSGHGEGGTLVGLEIQGWERGNPYDSTPEDCRRAEQLCELVNKGPAGGWTRRRSAGWIAS